MKKTSKSLSWCMLCAFEETCKYMVRTVFGEGGFLPFVVASLMADQATSHSKSGYLATAGA